ncbi:MAG: hypothetical protein NVS1B11_37990 [Terriglobales bacterium]
MRIRMGLALGLCLSLPVPTFADFRYDETTKITGGSIVSMTKFAGAFSKQARQITDPVNSTILVKGNRMAHINQEMTEIVDLDKETVTKIDHHQKQYSVVTFKEMKQAMEEAAKNAEKQQAQRPAPTQEAARDNNPPPPEMKFKVNVTNTGASKQVAGLTATESILKMSLDAKDQKSGQTGGMAMTNDMWMTPEIPGYREVRDFNERMATKMGTMLSSAMPSMISPQLLGAQPGMSSGMADMAKEMSKLKGVPVSQIMRMGTTMDGAPLPAASEAPLPPSSGPTAGSIAGQAAANAADSAASAGTATAENKAASHMGNFGGVASSLGNLGGFGGFRKKKKQEQPEPPQAGNVAPSGSVLLESSTEMTNFSSAAIDSALFDIPVGYKSVPSEYQKSHQ